MFLSGRPLSGGIAWPHIQRMRPLPASILIAARRRTAATFLLVAGPAFTIPFGRLAGQSATAAPVSPAVRLPERLSDSAFWKLVTDISEPGGFFRIPDNFTSNERDIGVVTSSVRTTVTPGGVYMGVGPEQNLTYIAASRPKMAFIVDIRRQAVMHHLMYKALFELAKDRADFISLLFALPRPGGLDSASSIQQIWYAFDDPAVSSAPRGASFTAGDTTLAGRTFARINDQLTKKHGFTFTGDEADYLDHVYRSFVQYGPRITTSGPVGRAVGFSDLTLVTGIAGDFVSFLGTEESYRFVKSLHERNLFVPVSGNFGGPKAIRAIGTYLKEHGGTVTAFYVSNVESYLFMDGIAGQFYANVGTLPIDEKSVFIRPGGLRMGVALCPIDKYLRAYLAGRVLGNSDANRCAE
jgi:hypothetical protein